MITVYVLMREWENGYDSADSLEDIYATRSEAHSQAQKLESENKDQCVSWRIIRWDVVEKGSA